MKHLFIVLTSCLFFCAFSCNDGESDVNQDSNCDGTQTWTIQDAEGLDGCKWMLQSDDFDFRLEPMNLLDFLDAPADGNEVKINYNFRDDIATTCIAGRIVEISCLD